MKPLVLPLAPLLLLVVSAGAASKPGREDELPQAPAARPTTAGRTSRHERAMRSEKDIEASRAKAARSATL
jgi:hypothetical protein